jgi:hypothetical protein
MSELHRLQRALRPMMLCNGASKVRSEANWHSKRVRLRRVQTSNVCASHLIELRLADLVKVDFEEEGFSVALRLRHR